MKYISPIIIVIASLLFGVSMAAAQTYSYERQEIDLHVLHIVKLSLKDYKIALARANNGTGRETVPSIAKRNKAVVAINGGFFEADGTPSRTLVINGRQYSMQDAVQALMLINANKLSLLQGNPKESLSTTISMVTGIPMLLRNGEIIPELYEKGSEFYTQPHARTAVGLTADGNVVIIVAEHHYLRDVNAITVGEMQEFIKTNEQMLAELGHTDPNHITLSEIKEILEGKYITDHKRASGLTMVELAEFMQQYGCQEAINLDGGGSSTLWIDGKVMNLTIGDIDGGNGMLVLRPVSDAVLFKQR